MALLSYAQDAEGGSGLQFAIVADDTNARYVWPALGPQLWDDSRVQELNDLLQANPQNEQEWLDLAATNVGLLVVMSDPIQVESLDAGMAEARPVLNQGTGVSSDPPVLSRVREAFDQVSGDYPGFGEDEVDDDPEAMNNFILSMLGGIDPEGPNGWILREIENPTAAEDGAPAPGVVTFPGVDPYASATSTPEAPPQ